LASRDAHHLTFSFSAGRGPNPKKAELDDELSAYKVKPVEKEAAASVPAPAVEPATAKADE
jgi:hypothetical protein